jgi:hypothetical protein
MLKAAVPLLMYPCMYLSPCIHLVTSEPSEVRKERERKTDAVTDAA